MKVSSLTFPRLLTLGFACLLSFKCFCFALLGPYEDWMQYSNAFRFPNDIGGPMALDSEYRWNVPVITYGFDQSFMDFFGTEGKASVEAAIATLNSLPPASQILPTNYLADTRGFNWAVYGQRVFDLKSETMHVLLERLGLGSPARSIFVLRHFDPRIYPDRTLEYDPLGWPEEWDALWESNYPRRNYDPETLAPSFFVNGFMFFGSVQVFGGAFLDFVEVPSGPFYRDSFSAVAENDPFVDPMEGTFYKGFTRDDVGGLKYLLNKTNVNYEFLLPGVRGRGRNANSWVNGAWRPGVEKITFRPQPWDALRAKWLPSINRYTDTYLTKGAVKHQTLERTVNQPDILFSAANQGQGNAESLFVGRTDTSGWQNNALSNGNANGAGPGVINSPVKITFHKMGAYCGSSTGGPYVNFMPQQWGKFDNTNAPPILFPVRSYSGRNELVVNFKLLRSPTNFPLTTWQLPCPLGSPAVLQRSTNLSSWIPVATFTNTGGVVDWYHSGSGRQEFFRVVPE